MKIDYQVVIVVVVITACMETSLCPQVWKMSYCPLGGVGHNSGDIVVTPGVYASSYDNVAGTRNLNATSIARK